VRINNFSYGKKIAFLSGIMLITQVGGGCGVDLLGSGQGPVAGSCEHGDKPLGSGAMELVLSILAIQLLLLF
jgi:hypothetical protein